MNFLEKYPANERSELGEYEFIGRTLHNSKSE